MGFDFWLQQPPCDVSFLAVVDGPALYGSDEASEGSAKQSIIQQIGWHELQLPPEWFFSRRAYRLMRRVIRTMQCTIQYLVYRHDALNGEVVKAREEVCGLREENDRTFAELAELRRIATLNDVKHRDCDAMNGKAEQEHLKGCSRKSKKLHGCLYCGNLYPSTSSLFSHVAKRHGKCRCCFTAEDTHVVHQDSPAPVQPSNNPLMAELALLKQDLAFLRGVAMATQRAENQDENGMSPTFDGNTKYIMEQRLRPYALGNGDTTLQQKQEEQGLQIRVLRDDLRATQSHVAQLGALIQQQQEKGANVYYSSQGGIAATVPQIVFPPPQVAPVSHIEQCGSGGRSSNLNDSVAVSLRRRSGRRGSCDGSNPNLWNSKKVGFASGDSTLDTSGIVSRTQGEITAHQRNLLLDHSLENTLCSAVRSVRTTGTVRVVERFDANSSSVRRASECSENTHLQLSNCSRGSTVFGLSHTTKHPGSLHTPCDLDDTALSHNCSRSLSTDPRTSGALGDADKRATTLCEQSCTRASVMADSYVESEEPKEQSSITKVTSVSSTHISKPNSSRSRKYSPTDSTLS